MKSTPVLQRSKRDLLITGVLVIVSLLFIVYAWASAPIRQASLSAHESEVTVPGAFSATPTAATEIWRAPAQANNTKPVAFHGQVLTSERSDDLTKVEALDAQGNALWTYTRPEELCAMMSSWGANAVLDYRSARGCGEVVDIDGSTMNYAGTRSAHASEQVMPISSNDYAGIVSRDRVELWRKDMVRTMEYGDVVAKHEKDQQPHEDCDIDSALTRKEDIAIIERCQDEYWLRIMKTKPEDARKPEISAETKLGTDPAHLVAIAQNYVKIYIDGTQPQLATYNKDGNKFQSTDAEAFAPTSNAANVFYPEVGDLKHHMSWYDGKRLYLFNPGNLKNETILEDSLGTGVNLGENILYPTAAGWSVLDPKENTVIATIPVDRGTYQGPVSLGIIGSTVIEQRGQELVALKMES